MSDSEEPDTKHSGAEGREIDQPDKSEIESEIEKLNIEEPEEECL